MYPIINPKFVYIHSKILFSLVLFFFNLSPFTFVDQMSKGVNRWLCCALTVLFLFPVHRHFVLILQWWEGMWHACLERRHEYACRNAENKAGLWHTEGMYECFVININWKQNMMNHSAISWTDNLLSYYVTDPKICYTLLHKYDLEFSHRWLWRITIFWDIKPYSPLKVNRRFGGKYGLYSSESKNKPSKIA
jgi:hypothetical protein